CRSVAWVMFRTEFCAIHSRWSVAAQAHGVEVQPRTLASSRLKTRPSMAVPISMLRACAQDERELKKEPAQGRLKCGTSCARSVRAFGLDHDAAVGREARDQFRAVVVVASRDRIGFAAAFGIDVAGRDAFARKVI